MALRYPTLTRDQQVALTAAGTPIPDGSGRVVRRGVIVSAADLARSADTRATDAALDAVVNAQRIGGTPPALGPDQFAADAAKQRLLSTAGMVPGRNITPATVARATPAQIAGELAGQADFLKLAPFAAERAAMEAEKQAIDAALGRAPATFPGQPAPSGAAQVPMPSGAGAPNLALPPMTMPPEAAPASPLSMDPGLMYFQAGGRSPQTAATLSRMAPPPPSRLGQSRVIDGVTYVYTQEGNLSPLPKDRPEAPSIQTVEIGGRRLTVGPGGKYFDERGQPIDFSTDKPMDITTWLMTGNSPAQYQAYLENYRAAQGRTPATAPTAQPPVFDKALAGRRIKGPDGRIGTVDKDGRLNYPTN